MEIIFGIPIFKARIENNAELQELAAPLLEEIIHQEEGVETWSCDCYTSFSREASYDWKPFMEQYSNALSGIVREEDWAFLEKKTIRFHEPWMNAYTTPHQFQERHDHYGSDLSAVHFLHFDDTHLPTVFKNPLSGLGHGIKYLSSKPEMQKHYNAFYSPEVQEGDILFFPSFLEHAVPPSPDLKKKRVTISLNTEFVPHSLVGFCRSLR